MKALKPGPIATIAVAVSTLVCSRAAAQCSPPAAYPKKATIHNIAVTLIDAATPGACVASNIKPGQTGYKILTSNKGDVVNWNITNNCSHDVTFAITDFRPHTSTDVPFDQPLVEAASSLSVLVRMDGIGVLTAHIKTGINHYSRVCTLYDYGFEEVVASTPPSRRPIGDPQIEIPQ
jgi:hypothetical protein